MLILIAIVSLIVLQKLSAKESRLHLAKKELNNLKENLRSTDLTRILALSELENTKKTIEKLNEELSVFNSKSNDAMVTGTETSDNIRAKSSSNIFDRTLSSCRRELDTLTVQYLATALKLNEAKKELGNLRHDYNSASRSFNAALRQSSVADAASKTNDKASIELCEKISVAKKLIQRVKLASEQAVEEKLSIGASREILRHEYRSKLDAAAKIRESLKKELNPDTTRKIQKLLEITYDQSNALKQDIHKANNACTELAAILALELDNENAILQELLDEEKSLQQLIESLKLELETTKKELFAKSDKEAKARRLADDLKTELERNTLELEKCMKLESLVSNTSDEMKATFINLTTEIHLARQESINVSSKIEALMIKADIDRDSIKEYEVKLQQLNQEVNAARSAKTEVLERMKLLSERKDSGAKITLSNKEFNSLRFKINKSAKLSDTKVSVTTVQKEVLTAFQNNTLEIFAARQKELQTLKLYTTEALKTASELEADKIKLEEELQSLKQSMAYYNNTECVPNVKTEYEMAMEQMMTYPKEMSKSHSTSSARRRRVTLGDFLKMGWEGMEKGKRTHMRSFSGLIRST